MRFVPLVVLLGLSFLCAAVSLRSTGGVLIVCSEENDDRYTHLVQDLLHSLGDDGSGPQMRHALVTPTDAPADLFVHTQWRHPTLATRPLIRDLQRTRAHAAAWAKAVSLAADAGAPQTYLVFECNAVAGPALRSTLLRGYPFGTNVSAPALATLRQWRHVTDVEGGDLTAGYAVTSAGASALLHHTQRHGVVPLWYLLEHGCGLGPMDPLLPLWDPANSLQCWDAGRVSHVWAHESVGLAFGATEVWVPPQLVRSGGHNDDPIPAAPGYDPSVWTDLRGRKRPRWDWEAAGGSGGGEGEVNTPSTGADGGVIELRQWAFGNAMLEGSQRLAASALLYGWPLEMVGLDEVWEGYLSLLQWIHARLTKLRRELPRERWLSTVILVMDAYDQVMTDSPQNVLDVFLSNVTGGLQRVHPPAPILFSAEAGCWPHSVIRDAYPLTTSKYRFLNSGNILTYAWALEEALREVPYYKSTHACDQGYWTIRYVAQQGFVSHKLALPASRNFSELIDLDRDATVFQSLHGVWMRPIVMRDPLSGRTRNTETGTQPMVLHGHGSIASKSEVAVFADLGLEQHWVRQPVTAVLPGMQADHVPINLATWTHWTRKWVQAQHDATDGAAVPDAALPRIHVVVHVEPSMPVVTQSLQSLAGFSYPRSRMTMTVFDRTPGEGQAAVRAWVAAHRDTYATPVAHVTDARFLQVWTQSLDAAGDAWDYCLFVTADTRITEPDALQALVVEGKPIVAPMLHDVTSDTGANFWGSVDVWLHHRVSRHSAALGDRTLRGVWNVGAAWGAVLVHRSVAPNVKRTVVAMCDWDQWRERRAGVMVKRTTRYLHNYDLHHAFTWLSNRKVWGVVVPLADVSDNGDKAEALHDSDSTD